MAIKLMVTYRPRTTLIVAAFAAFIELTAWLVHAGSGAFAMSACCTGIALWLVHGLRRRWRDLFESHAGSLALLASLSLVARTAITLIAGNCAVPIGMQSGCG